MKYIKIINTQGYYRNSNYTVSLDIHLNLTLNVFQLFHNLHNYIEENNRKINKTVLIYTSVEVLVVPNLVPAA